MSDNEEDPQMNENWNDWDDDVGSNTPYICLFCPAPLQEEKDVHQHLQQVHNFSFQEIINLHQLDAYGRIQLVNYIRQTTLLGMETDHVCKDLLKSSSKSLFQLETYLKPVIQDDRMLYDLEFDQEDQDDMNSHNEKEYKDGSSIPTDIATLESENQALKEQLLKYSSIVRKYVVPEDEEKEIVNTKGPDNDTYYFDSYSEVSIHRDMLLDQVRTNAYRNAIMNNSELFKDKVILDVGCGTGILSMFAAQCGASKVIGIDCSEMGKVAKQIVVDNGLDQIVTIIQGKAEEVLLPVDSVDIIVSEWMGYCLLYESMLDTVLFARDKWLKPNGICFPDQAFMYLQGCSDSSKHFGYWDNVYGFNMSAVKAHLPIQDGEVKDVDPQDIITKRSLLKHIDVTEVAYEELNFTSKFSLEITTSGEFYGFVSSFDIAFDKQCKKPEYFTTGVEGTPTHWHQVVFYVREPFPVNVGDIVNGIWSIKRNSTNPRFLDVVVEWQLPGVQSMTQKQNFNVH